jgi:hypothetical protein
MPKIKPMRGFSEHDVLNFYAWSGIVPAEKGTFVKIQGSGWKNDNEPIEMLGAPGASYTNTVSQRYGVIAKVASCGTGENVLGMLLYDVKETDENGEKLIYNPRKMHELQCVLSGQAVPILTRGFVLYSGIDGTPTAGSVAYVSGGAITTSSQNATESSKIGRFLGTKDVNGWALVKIML